MYMKMLVKIANDLLGLKDPVGLGWKNIQKPIVLGLQKILPGLKNPAGFLAGLCLICCTSCDNDKIYKEERYKNVVYLLSGSENIYTESYSLNQIESVKYFSVGCGGSNPNSEEIVVTIEPDLAMFHDYNRRNFDHESMYAKLLPASKYEIESYTVTIPAHPSDQYVKTPVSVRPLGLSPDSVYFIPLAIKSVSHYEVNEVKNNLLYRVTIENDYASQKVATNYTKKGTEKNLTTGVETMLTGIKLVQPLTKDKVRTFVGSYSQGQETTVDDIKRLAIEVEIKEDNTIEITPHGNVIVLKLFDNPLYNLYDPEVTLGTTVERVMYLHYRYCVLNDDGTYDAWHEVMESLTRIEED